jgi:hypothetical protein
MDFHFSSLINTKHCSLAPIAAIAAIFRNFPMGKCKNLKSKVMVYTCNACIAALFAL